MHLEKHSEAFGGRHLSAADNLSEDQYDAISTLIYETDPYIYPAMFACDGDSKAAAIRVLPEVFERGNDAMFRKENLYIFSKSNDIVGLILWHKGSLHWDPNLLFCTATELGIPLNLDNLIAVSKGYVDDKYNEGVDSGIERIALINICVDSRMRGMGIGQLMMSSFFEAHPSDSMELCVLADNLGAIRLYEKMGFHIVNKAPGFSLAEWKPTCYDMIR